LSVAISIGGGETGQPAWTPLSVRVKYLLANHVTAKNNITWAGQSLGANFKSDGRLQDGLNVVNFPCDTATNTCTITVPAPGFALVFLNDKAYTDSTPSRETLTFATTAYTRADNTATVKPHVLETSNGHSRKDRVNMHSTGKGSSSGTSVTLRERLTNVLLVGLGASFGATLFVVGDDPVFLLWRRFSLEDEEFFAGRTNYIINLCALGCVVVFPRMSDCGNL
jgi:hypothetical protein